MEASVPGSHLWLQKLPIPTTDILPCTLWISSGLQAAKICNFLNVINDSISGAPSSALIFFISKTTSKMTVTSRHEYSLHFYILMALFHIPLLLPFFSCTFFQNFSIIVWSLFLTPVIPLKVWHIPCLRILISLAVAVRVIHGLYTDNPCCSMHYMSSSSRISQQYDIITEKHPLFFSTCALIPNLTLLHPFSGFSVVC